MYLRIKDTHEGNCYLTNFLENYFGRG